ncbi:alpha/beta hydrolase fold domain-containing protein [Stieleria marina]|uniref:alpha/beta hydrolase fold domain-containing protein n=1 Tax=Stieleria marina TaxID=1930275 RepID=UPI003AF3F638
MCSVALADERGEGSGSQRDSDSGKQSAAAKATVQETADLVYAEIDGQQLKLDLYVPQTQRPCPLLVWIHGGGWRAGSRKRVPVLPMTEQGFAVASISYRFTDKAVFPAQIYDCKAAIRWLRGNAKAYGYDADWIAVSGGSAGGHLALLMGVSGEVNALEGTGGGFADQSSAVQAIVDYFGPSDFVLRGRTQPERAYTQESGSFALLGGVRDGKLSGVMEKFASPTHYVSAEDPPLLIFHGTEDKVVLHDQSERIANAYAAAGLDAKLVSVKKAGHGGKVFFREPYLEMLTDFLQRHRPAPE